MGNQNLYIRIIALPVDEATKAACREIGGLFLFLHHRMTAGNCLTGTKHEFNTGQPVLV